MMERTRCIVHSRGLLVVLAFESAIHGIVHHLLLDIVRGHILLEHLHGFLEVFQWHLNEGE